MNVNISNLCFYICVCVVAQKSQGRKGGEARWGGGEAVGRREAVELVRATLLLPASVHVLSRNQRGERRAAW